MKNPALSVQQILALTVFMLSQRLRDVPESYLAPDKLEEKVRRLHPQPLSGEQIYHQYCFACHDEGSFGRWDKTFKRFIPAIRGASLQATAARTYLEAQITQGRPGSQMPAWGKQAGGLLPAEVNSLLDYLQPPNQFRSPGATSHALPIPQRGDANRGAVLFIAYCAGCHGIAGHGGVAPQIDNPVFQQAASDEFIITTIRNGRKGTAMPSFQPQIPGSAAFSEADLGNLLAFVRELGRRHSGGVVAKSQNSPLSSTGNREGPR
jgi:mono/diheme cytochrome c family protein